MLLRYFYDNKLAHASYLVGCQKTGEAIVIDPARDVTPYLTTAKAEGVRIVAAAETHIHADFVSGARELMEEQGATLYLSAEGGSDWQYQYAKEGNHQFLKDGDRFSIGNLLFEVVHTPGHTPESICFLLTDSGSGADEPMGIFTGDFLFVGDVGRPDLLETAVGVTGAAEEGARMMFASLKRIKEYPDYLQVWPAHGAGSACGKALGAVPSSTVGYEKRCNWALRHESETDFISELLQGQPEPPAYFPIMKRVNKEGPTLLRDLPSPEEASPRLETVEEWLASGAVVLDTRPAAAFAKGHVRGSINIPYNKSFASWVGWLVDYNRPVYLITESVRLMCILLNMRAVGADRVAGYVDATRLFAHTSPSLGQYEEVSPQQIAEQILHDEVHLIDVRNNSEWQEGHIPGAKHITLGTLPHRLNEIPDDKSIVVQCRSGARSAMAASILLANGFGNVLNLAGGMLQWKKDGLPEM